MSYMTETEILNEIEYLEGWKADIAAMYQKDPCPASAVQLAIRDHMIKDLTYRIQKMNILLDLVRRTK